MKRTESQYYETFDSTRNAYDPPDGERGYKDKASGVDGTRVVARDKNAIQEEIVQTLEVFGITLDGDRVNQLGAYLGSLLGLLQDADAGGEIVSLEAISGSGNDHTDDVSDRTFDDDDKPDYVLKPTGIDKDDLFPTYATRATLDHDGTWDAVELGAATGDYYVECVVAGATTADERFVFCWASESRFI